MSRDRYFSVSMYTTMQRLGGWLGEDKGLSILDYGCGPGSFMAFLREQLGFLNVEGIEINRESVMIGKRNFGLTIASSKDELSRQSYDCVLLLEVIEHLSRPDLYLKEITELVKPGGSLLITTPAVDNMIGRRLPSHCPHYTAPSHVSLFTTRAMELLLRRFGFSVQRMEFDHTNTVVARVAASIFYDLDFLSPQNDDDASDMLYTPNALGHLIRCRTNRSGSLGPLGRPLHVFDSLFARFASRVRSFPRNNHLYVLARKAPGSLA
jgi:SAM-dependent methyltransferase